MVDKLVLAKSLGSLGSQNYLAITDWLHSIWGRVQAGNTWPGKWSNKEQNCQNVNLVSPVSPGGTSWLQPAQRNNYENKLVINWRQTDSFSCCQFHGRYLSVISTALGVELTTICKYFTQINYNAFHLLIFIYKFLIRLWGFKVLHIFYTLIPFCFLPRWFAPEMSIKVSQ